MLKYDRKKLKCLLYLFLSDICFVMLMKKINKNRDFPKKKNDILKTHHRHKKLIMFFFYCVKKFLSLHHNLFEMSKINEFNPNY